MLPQLPNGSKRGLSTIKSNNINNTNGLIRPSQILDQYLNGTDQFAYGGAPTMAALDFGQAGIEAASGALAGAAAGSVIPGIGTAIGAVVGAVGGFISGIFKSDADRKEEFAKKEAAFKKQIEFEETRADEIKDEMKVTGSPSEGRGYYAAFGFNAISNKQLQPLTYTPMSDSLKTLIDPKSVYVEERMKAAENKQIPRANPKEASSKDKAKIIDTAFSEYLSRHDVDGRNTKAKYIGGDSNKARKEFIQSDKELGAYLTAKGIDPNVQAVLANRLAQEGIIDEAIRMNNDLLQQGLLTGNNKTISILNRSLYPVEHMKDNTVNRITVEKGEVQGFDSLGLDDVETYSKTIKTQRPITAVSGFDQNDNSSIQYIPYERENEKGRIVTSGTFKNIEDALEFKVGVIEQFRTKAKLRFPNKSDKELNIITAIMYNYGPNVNSETIKKQMNNPKFESYTVSKQEPNTTIKIK